MTGVCTREDGAGRYWLAVPLVGCGQNMNDCSCISRCQVFGTVTKEGWGVWDCACGGENIRACERREERKGEGVTEREREQELMKRKREGASGNEAGLPLQHCSLSFASLRKLSFSSPCLSLLLIPSCLAAWPWPQWTPWSPCPPREEDRNSVAEERETRRGDTEHFASLMRIWKLINRRQQRRTQSEEQDENKRELKRANC